MIYTAPIDEIRWDDIAEFCEQGVKEGAYLDYKKDFPSELEKTIAAMANTSGGVILIGIQEDEENKPVLPINGITFQRGLSERVMNIILSNITPPVFPEIQVCRNETGEKAIILIRIPQSHQTPHAISSNTKVYLRTGDRNKPEELATIDEISWLNDQRNKSVELREFLYQQAQTRWNNFIHRISNLLISDPNDFQEPSTGILTISTCPTYPRNVYKNPSQLIKFYERIRIHDFLFTETYFPPINKLGHPEGILVQDGIVLINYRDKGERFFFTEIHSLGFYFFRQPIKRKLMSYMSRPREFVSGAEIITRIDEFLSSAHNFYREIEYWGYIDIDISLTNIIESGIELDWLKSAFSDPPYGFSPDHNVTYTFSTLVGNLVEEKDRIIFEAAQKLFWNFGLEFTPEHLEIFDKRIKRNESF